MRVVSSRVGVLVLAGLALVALVLLASGLPGLEFRPAKRFRVAAALSDSTGKEAPEATEKVEPVGMVTAAASVSVTYLLLLVALPLCILYLLVSRRLRKEVLWRSLPLLVVVALILLSRRQPEILEVVAGEAPIGQQALDAGVPAAVFDPHPPPWLTWGLALGLGALGIAGVAWLLRPRPPALLNPLGEVYEGAALALERLRAGADVRDTVMRCYFDMNQVLSQERSLTREAAMTPREFEQTLVRAGLPEPSVRRLTRLFEHVRYGVHAAGTAEQQEAISCLEAIVRALGPGQAEEAAQSGGPPPRDGTP